MGGSIPLLAAPAYVIARSKATKQSIAGSSSTPSPKGAPPLKNPGFSSPIPEKTALRLSLLRTRTHYGLRPLLSA